MDTNFGFLRHVMVDKSVYEACHNVELCYERVGNGTAIREARYALEMLLNYYIHEKNLGYVQLGLVDKINIAIKVLKASELIGQNFLNEKDFNFIREFGNTLVHNPETIDYPLHWGAIEMLYVLYKIAITIVADLGIYFFVDIEKHSFSESYQVFEDVMRKNI